MKSTRFHRSLALTLATLSTHSLANGLAINEQSASAMGTAFAGRASSALDASTLFGNPAGMSRLDRQASGGLAFISVDTDIDGAFAPTVPGSPGVSGTARGDMAPDSFVPFGYFVTPLNDRWHFGLGVYVPYGLASDYEDRFVGRYKALESRVQVVTLQPTLSYRLNERVSVGFGPTISRTDGKLSNALRTGPTDGEVDIEGDDIGYGFNVGVLVAMTDRLDWGLTYHSKIDFELEGRTRISNIRVQALPGVFVSPDGRYDATLDITMPESLDTSLSYRLDDRWTLHAGATWTRWSRLEGIRVENRGVPAAFASRFDVIEEDLQWEDSWSYAIGAAYRLTPRWTLRTGFALDASPTSDAHRTARIPVGNRKLLAVGAGWSPSDALTLDTAYFYLREDEARVDQTPRSAAQPGYSGRYRNSAHGLGLQLTYRF